MINARTFSSLLVMSFALAFMQSPNAGESLDHLVASVNGEAITQTDLNRQTQLLVLRLKQNNTELPPLDLLKKQILDRMILEKLQLQMAAQQGISTEKSAIEKALKEIASRDNLTLEEMRGYLEKEGVPFSQFRAAIQTEITLSKLQQKEVAQNINISQSELNQFLNSSMPRDSHQEFELAHILLPIPEEPSAESLRQLSEEGKALVKALKAGADFSKMAIEKSSSPHALEGGYLGWRNLASIPTAFAKIVPTLEKNQIYGPIQDSSGVHIIKLMDKRSPEADIFRQQDEIHVRQIVIHPKHSDQKSAAQLYKFREQIRKGASFATLALKHSEDARSAAQGGDMGWLPTTNMTPAFKAKAEQLALDEISEPFKTPLGWHLIQVLGKRNRAIPSESMREKAMEALYQQKFEEQLTAWLQRLRAEADVHVYLND